MSRSSLSKKRPFCASDVDADADPAVNDDVTGQVSRPCWASKSVYADPAGTNSTEADQVRYGKTGAAVSGEIIVCVAADVNADYRVAWGFSALTVPYGKGVHCPSSDPMRSEVANEVRRWIHSGDCRRRR